MNQPKRITVKVFAPGNKRSTRMVYAAPADAAWSVEGISKQIARVAEEIHQTAPTLRYRMVQVGRSSFNFIHING